MNFYISDMHWFHKNVTGEGSNFDNRPYQTMAEMHADMKRKWNDKVGNADHVYILGDMTWKVNDESIGLISTLKGNKHLILGNHDSTGVLRFRQLFNEIVPYKVIDDNANGANHRLVLSHFPIANWNGMKRGWLQLYGHVHNTEWEQDFQNYLDAMEKKYNERYIARNVGCMLWDYVPVSLSEILQKG